MGVDGKLGLFLSSGGSRGEGRQEGEEAPADHRISWKVLGRLELGLQPSVSMSLPLNS